MPAVALRSRLSNLQMVVVASVAIGGLLLLYHLFDPSDAQLVRAVPRTASEQAERHDPAHSRGVPVDITSFGDDKRAILQRLGVYFARDDADWLRRSCDPDRKFRAASILTGIGNLTFYIYDNGFVDTSVSERALHGEMFERDEIERFLLITKRLPLIDAGANVGLVTLQAAIQGREVVALEPIYENAVRLCRSAVDFGHGSLVHVINNAASSTEGSVTMAMDTPRHVARFEISRGKGWGYGPTTAYSILMDRLADILPFKQAALKLDVESHEGHAIAGAQRLFQEVDIPFVWLEWEWVKKIPGAYGGQGILQFMKEHHLEPHDLMTGKPLDGDFLDWPFTVLFVKAGWKIE